VYVDFDGTIAAGEPTDALFDRFADSSWRQIEEEWQQGRLSSRACMSQQVELMRAEPAAIDEFLRTIEIDPHFPKFVQLCRAFGGRVVIVSDGLDRVVRTVMRRAGWDLPFSANRLKWMGGDRWKLEFPHARKDCRAAMGNCKCGHRRTHTSSPAILVGDGRSDFCLAEHVHLVLAKGRLADHCRENSLPYVQFHNFADATQVLHAWLDALGTDPATLACGAPAIIKGIEEGVP
jgi:2,3-diketo-5-methylthio-1-phosphopentane phosphatase